jgi:hypothetical protein
VRLVISQPQAAAYIQLPMFAIRVASQITVNGLWRNGDQTDRDASSPAALVRPVAGTSTDSADGFP